MELEQDIQIGSVVSNDNNLTLYVVAEIATIKTIGENRIEIICFPYDLKDRHAWQRRETYNEEEDGLELEYHPTEESLLFVRSQVENMESFDEDEDTDEDEVYSSDFSRSKRREIEDEDEELPSAAEYEMDIEQLEKENNKLTNKHDNLRKFTDSLIAATLVGWALALTLLLMLLFK